MREVAFGLEKNVRLSVCWLDGVVSGGDVSTCVLRPLTQSARAANARDEAQALYAIIHGGVYSYSVHECTTTDDTVAALTHGHCAVIFDTLQTALCFEVKSDKTRGVSRADARKVPQGCKGLLRGDHTGQHCARAAADMLTEAEGRGEHRRAQERDARGGDVRGGRRPAGDCA